MTDAKFDEKPKMIVSGSEFRRLSHTNPNKVCEMYFDLVRAYEKSRAEIAELKKEIARLTDLVPDDTDLRKLKHAADELNDLEAHPMSNAYQDAVTDLINAAWALFPIEKALKEAGE